MHENTATARISLLSSLDLETTSNYNFRKLVANEGEAVQTYLQNYVVGAN